MYIYKHRVKLNKVDYCYYASFVGSFLLLSLVLNLALNQNFMISINHKKIQSMLKRESLKLEQVTEVRKLEHITILKAE